MYEATQEILDYLPINQSRPEADYIEHLWDAFEALDALDVTKSKGRPFAMMPFHLLFMLALQFKVLRISREQRSDYDLAFTMESPREDERAILNPGSAFDLGLLKESKLIDLLKIVGMNPERVREIKFLVRNRNDNLAHAKGGIEQDPNERIDQYLGALRDLQPLFLPHNDCVAERWLSEITNDDDLGSYLDIRLPDSQLCLADFRTGQLTVFGFDEDALFEEWRAVVSRVHVSGSRSGILWLKHVAQNHPIDERRAEIIRLMTEAEA